jgi:hypothetical protein
VNIINDSCFNKIKCIKIQIGTIIFFGGMKMNTRDLFSLQGKTAIVTGGGRGLGEQIAEAYGDAGVIDGGTSASVQ